VTALADAGFPFEADVVFRVDPYAVCDGVRCADIRTVRRRRTIGIAPEALESEARLRASLLEVWDRYREPRPGSRHDLARGTLRVIQDGPRAGVHDRQTLRIARLTYRQIWTRLPPGERTDLPDPDTL
jgi:hypothetical protein